MELTSEAYHRHPAIGSSMGKTFRQSRRQYQAIYVEKTQEPKPPTKAMDFGTVAHAAILEPHVIDELIVEIPETALTSNGQRRGKSWDSFVADHPGKIFFGAGDIRKVRAMQQACHSHAIAGKLLRMDGPTEDTHIVHCNRSGLERKCRVDKHTRRYLVDVKTTGDVTPAAFSRVMANLDYEFSAAWYSDVVEQSVGDRKQFVWVAVCTEPPHAVRVYALGPESEMHALLDMENTLSCMQGCYEIGDWSEPGENEVIELSLPKWKTISTGVST